MKGTVRRSEPSRRDVRNDAQNREIRIMRLRQLPNSGDFNVVLGIEYKSAAAFQPDKAKYDAFMDKWGEKKPGKVRRTRPDVS